MDISITMSQKPAPFKIAIFDLPTEIEDAPFYEMYANWISCHEEVLRSDLQSLVYNKTQLELSCLEYSKDYFSFRQYPDIYPIETDDPLQRFISACSCSGYISECFDWISEFIYNTVQASRQIPTSMLARHAIWLDTYPGVFLVKSLQNDCFHEQCDHRLERLRLQVLGGMRKDLRDQYVAG